MNSLCLIAFVLASGSAFSASERPDRVPAPSRSELASSLSKLYFQDRRFEAASLERVIESLVEQSGVPIKIDEQAFKDEKNDPNFELREFPVTLDKIQGMAFGQALQRVLDQVDAVCFVEAGYLSIVPASVAHRRAGRTEPFDPKSWRAEPLTRRALVHLGAEKLPLWEITKSISRQTGANIVITSEAKERAQAELTATLYNTPVKAAVELLAEMADLAVIERANVLLVTTPERARVWNLDHPEPPPVTPTQAPPRNAEELELNLPPLM